MKLWRCLVAAFRRWTEKPVAKPVDLSIRPEEVVPTATERKAHWTGL